MSFSISSNILRKSRYGFAFGYFLKTSPARARSTSHRATIFWSAQQSRSPRPWPPTPIPAMRTLSLGGVSPLAATAARGTIVNAATAAPAVPRNARRVMFLIAASSSVFVGAAPCGRPVVVFMCHGLLSP